jgi:predicted lipoprotein with Yx(FWY)xxD motif
MHASSLRRTLGRRRGAVLALPALAAAGALTLGACSQGAAASPGSGPVYGSTSPSSSTGSAPAGSGTALAVRGKILTDGRGFTVYAFEADKGTMSNCSGACATAWPPVTTTGTTPKVGTGVKQTLVGQTARSDGTRQLTYAGHPLYLFEGDSAPGNTNGQGSQAFGARWDVVTPTGQEVTTGA